MSKRPKIIKQAEKPVHPDLRRLVKAMQSTLQRRYPDSSERQIVAQRIMQEVKAK